MLRKAEGVLNRLIEKSWWSGDKKRRGDILLSASSVIRTRCLSALSWPGADFHSDSFPVFVEGFRHGISPSRLCCSVSGPFWSLALSLCRDLCLYWLWVLRHSFSYLYVWPVCYTIPSAQWAECFPCWWWRPPPLHVLALRIWTLQWRSALSKLNPLMAL